MTSPEGKIAIFAKILAESPARLLANAELACAEFTSLVAMARGNIKEMFLVELFDLLHAQSKSERAVRSFKTVFELIRTQPFLCSPDVPCKEWGALRFITLAIVTIPC